jgi:hypothetical protein
MACGLLGGFVLSYIAAGAGPRDAAQFLMAAQRVLGGRELYGIGGADRSIDSLSVITAGPLLYPPLVAVLWLPLTVFPAPVAYAIWWGATVIAVVAVLAGLVRRRSAVTASAILILVIPLTYLLTVGNVDAFVVLASVAVWLLASRGSSLPAGVVAGVIGALKPTAFVLAVWLVTVSPRRGSIGLLIGLLAALTLSVAVAGWAAHIDYLEIALNRSTQPGEIISIQTALSVAGLERPLAVGLHAIAAVTALLGVVLLRDRPGHSFVIAVVLLAVGTPVVNIGSPAILLAALAPLAWPWPVAQRAPGNFDAMSAQALGAVPVSPGLPVAVPVTPDPVPSVADTA